MSQYNKTVLTHAGLELAKRANAGQAKFGITRAVTSADDWSHKTVQDLEEVTTIPNIMQQGTIMDTDEVESSNSVIGVSLCFTNKNLSTGYQIRIIGLYVKEEGRENDFLYAVTTAITPEYMPSFADKVLYRFNTQMYLVIGNAQSVNVVINDGTAVTHGQLDKYKVEVAENLKKLENTHKEDMSHVAKSASINGGAEILPDSTGKLNLVVPDPDLSKYVSLEQLGELLKAKADVADVNKQIKAVTDLANTKANTVDVDSKIKTVTDLANTKANSADVYTKTETDNQINKFDLSKVKFRKQFLNGDGDKVDKTWSATKNDDGTYTIDLFNDDWTAAKLSDVIYQLPSKADKSNTYTKTDVDNKVNEAKSNAQSTANQIWGEVNSLKGKQTKDSADANALSETGVYYCSSPAKNFPVWHWGTLVTSNGNGERASQLYFPDDNSAVWFRTLDGDWRGWVRLANIDDVNNAESSLTSSINAVSNKVNVTVPLFRKITAGNTWNDILGASNAYNPVLVSIRDEGGANTLGNFSAAVAFGGGDTKGVLNVAYSDHTARIIGGNGDAPVWHEDIAWKSDISNLQNIINQQNQTIQSLTSRLNNAENEINYIKANYVEGRRFPASQEAQAEAWENEKPTRLAMIEK
ncbi:MAG: pyocin knob domain-containing protein [Lactobacillus helveticus]|uniref:pyocin knob domain-containing protein n=1 Tax=Lactobacillus helveticus TaxID=1587 RepID=UPI0003584B88|nr:pyocin knob domain-containing protein [Lactobacillus helveticus]AGQ23680.1 hypothetical protein lhe_1196 [Lactobacillus helveticus CNRZ32]NRD34729.1 hypothetical protein [Lactobacillus helveticus]CDI63611.1 Putative uncharacterized protein orf55 [Lactobacillus helveticus CIRM-BIA 103]